MQTYTVIIPTQQDSGEHVYNTGDGHVELRERTVETGESLPSAPAYEIAAGSAEEVAEARGWEKM